jgi:spoIIIJ-associated protein
MKRVIATGRTVEDAVTSALVRLGVARSQAQVRVITEPVKGLFGLIGGRDAEVEVTVPSNPQEDARQFLLDVLKKMGVAGEVLVRSGDGFEGNPVLIDLVCSEEVLPVVIGRHGSTLDALQYLVNVVANQESERYVKFVVDAGDYRRRHQETLYRIAERAAERAVRTRQPVALKAMPAADRKLVHTHLQHRGDVRTTSEGKEPNRKVVIIPVVRTGSGKTREARSGLEF